MTNNKFTKMVNRGRQMLRQSDISIGNLRWPTNVVRNYLNMHKYKNNDECGEQWDGRKVKDQSEARTKGE